MFQLAVRMGGQKTFLSFLSFSITSLPSHEAMRHI